MPSVKEFNPDRDIPSLTGKVIFITGGTAGLGKTSIEALAKHDPAHIYFSGRSRSRGQAVIDSIKRETPNASLTFVEMDLTSISAVKACVAQFTHARLDVLMCNAGIMAHPPGLSKDGYEIQFATNHLGHAALIQALLPTMLRTAEDPSADVRLVILTSTGWRGHPNGGVKYESIKTGQEFGNGISKWIRYGQSKFANLVYAAELARRYPSITTVSVHPGVVRTDLVGDLGFMDKLLVYIPNIGQMLTPEQGSFSQLWVAAAAKKDKIVNGAFYMPVGRMSNSMLDKAAKDESIARELYEWTEKTLASVN